MEQPYFKAFTKGARHEGGQYLIACNGSVLIADNPADLYKKYAAARSITAYQAVGDYSAFGEGKWHISKGGESDFDTLCGRYLGFNYAVISRTGKENDEARQFTADEVMSIPRFCKHCKAAITKATQQP